MRSTAPRSMARQHGFTYMALIILVTIMGLVAMCSLQVGALVQRREKEQLLLEVGSEFHTALLSYAQSTPVGQSTMPPRLEDLLRDPRYPGVRRHLRRLVLDPLTGKNEWGVVTAVSLGRTGIIGVHSLSEAKPIKTGDFDMPFVQCHDKKSVSEWLFVAQPSDDPNGLPVVPDGPLVPVNPDKPVVPIPAHGRAIAPRN